MTTIKHAEQHTQDSSLQKKTVAIGTNACSIEGDKVIWSLEDAIAGPIDITIKNYDSSRAGSYTKTPMLVIKSAIATNVHNVRILDEDSTVLWTFAADNSVNNAFVVISLTDKFAWEVA